MYQLTPEQEENIFQVLPDRVGFKDYTREEVIEYARLYNTEATKAAIEREKVKDVEEGLKTPEELLQEEVRGLYPFKTREMVSLISKRYAAQFQPKWLPIDQMPKDDRMLKVQRWHILWGCPVTVSYRPDDDRPEFPWVDGTCTSTWPEQSFTPHFAYCLPSPPTLTL